MLQNIKGVTKMDKNDALHLWKTLGLAGEPVDMNYGLFGAAVSITPDIAENILETRNQGNRKIKIGAAESYADDMANDRWRITNAAIGFDVEQQLVDGQHRLMGVILSGKTIDFPVILGIPVDARACIDQNISRSIGDVIKMMGLNSDSKWAPVVKKIFQGGNNFSKRINNLHCLSLMEKFADAVDWLKAYIPDVHNVTSTAVFKGAIGRIYLYHKGNPFAIHKLKMFLSVIKDGQYQHIDNGEIYRNVARLRDRFMEDKFYGGQQIRQYQIVQYTFSRTLKGELMGPFPITKLKGMPLELYLLPHENEGDEAAAG